MEQTIQIPAENGVKEQTASYGKFNSAEELVKAYNSLESEFTKRSQKLKQLESEKQSKPNWAEKIDKLITSYPVAAELTEQIGEEIAKNDMTDDDNCLEKALLSVLSKNYKPPKEQAKDETVIGEVLKNSGIKDKIIDEYRSKFATGLPKTLPKGGEIPATPPVRPKSIFEAGKAALEILKDI